MGPREGRGDHVALFPAFLFRGNEGLHTNSLWAASLVTGHDLSSRREQRDRGLRSRAVNGPKRLGASALRFYFRAPLTLRARLRQRGILTSCTSYRGPERAALPPDLLCTPACVIRPLRRIHPALCQIDVRDVFGRQVRAVPHRRGMCSFRLGGPFRVVRILDVESPERLFPSST